MIHQSGIDLIKRFEGLRLEAYECAGGKWTIGYGTTTGVQPGMKISKAQAEEMLRGDLAMFDQGVRVACPKSTDRQHAAMVSLAYNIGLGAFRKSSVARNHNKGNYAAAGQAFALWNKAGGKVLAGLVARRAAEAELYLSSIPAGEAVPEPPRAQAEGEKPLATSKTVIGSTLGGASMAGVGLTEIAEQVKEADGVLAMLTPYLPVVSNVLIIVGMIGVAIALYARWKDRNEGRN